MTQIKIPDIFLVTCHTKHVGPNSTFVAIQGMKEDGTYYIADAIEKGATKIVVQDKAMLADDILKLIKDKNIELQYVSDTRKALAQLSAQALNYPAKSLKVIGITGTKGKSTTTFLLEHILKTAGYETALLSTVKNRILDQEFPCNLTTPQPDYLHVFFDVCRKQNVEYVIMEVAAQALTLSRVHGIDFYGAIFTNFSLEHSEFYSNIDEYFESKISIFNQLKSNDHVFINSDDSRLSVLSKQITCSTFGLYKNIEQYELSSQPTRKPDISAEIQGDLVSSINARIRISSNITKKNAAILLQTNAQNNIANENLEFNITAPALIGEFNVYNCLAAIGMAYSLGAGVGDLKNALITFKGTPGRLERYKLANGAIGCVDYAHNPASYQAILSTLRQLTTDLIVVFGAGGDRDKLKRPIMGAIASEIADQVILTSDNPRSENPKDIILDIQQGIKHKEKVSIELNRELAIRKAYAISKKESIIVLLGKGPDEYQEIKGVKYPFSDAGCLRSLQNHEIIN